jgi:Rad3-related DNA helicase
VFDEFFAKDSQSVTFLQPHEDGDFSLSVRNVELTGVFRSLMESRQRSFHFTSSVNDHRVLKNFTLVKTGLDSLGKIDIKDIRAKEESRINLLIPDNVPEFSLRKVNHPDFIKGLFQFIMKLLIRKRGKTLVVVNSLARLQKLATMLSPEMDKEKILFLQQHVDGGKEKLLRVVEGAGEVLVLASQVFYNLMDGEKAVFDTVIVERLPFPLPIDEIVRKRRASFRKRGHDDFDDYIVPHTLLKLKGVAGRLVPGGLLVVADNSLPDKGYYPLLEDVIRPNETYSTLHEYLPLSGDFL